MNLDKQQSTNVDFASADESNDNVPKDSAVLNGDASLTLEAQGIHQAENGSPEIGTAQAVGQRRFRKELATTIVLVAGAVIFGLSQMIGANDVAKVTSPKSEINRIRVGVSQVGTLSPPSLSSRYRGVVMPRRESSLAFRRSGRVTEIRVDTGDQVEANDVIALLDVSDLQAQAELNASELEVAKASYEEALAGPRKQTIQSAESRVDQLNAQLFASKQRLERRQKLYASRSISHEEVTDEQSQFDRLTASVQEAEAQLEQLLEGTRSEQVKAARARVSMAKAAIRMIEVQLEDSKIMAPFDCVIGSRVVDEGMILSPNQVVVSILERPPLEASFGIPVDAAAGIAVGQQVKISVGKNSGDSAQSTSGSNVTDRSMMIPAKVIRMQPRVDPVTRTREVFVEFETDEFSLVGQPATLWLDWSLPTSTVNGDSIDSDTYTKDGSTQFWVPSDSLVRSVRGLWGLYLAEPSKSSGIEGATDSQTEFNAKVVLLDAKIIRTAGSMTLVQANLQTTDRILTAGNHRVGPDVKIIAQIQQ